MGGNWEFSTKKKFLQNNPDMDGYGYGRTRWSGVGLKILSREGL